MGRFTHWFWALAIASLFLTPVVWAQQQQGQTDQTSSGQQSTQQSGGQQSTGQQSTGQSSTSPLAPLAPISGAKSGGQQGDDQNGSATETSKAPPLTGAEQYTLSRMGAGRSYLVPSFQFAQSVSTTGTGPFGTSDVSSVSTISGRFDLNHIWSHYALTASYAGTGFVYDRQSSYNSSAHMFTLSQRVLGRRSNFLLTDVVDYLPEASFGYARFSGMGAGGYDYGGLFGANGSNFDTTFIPSQSILTGSSSRVSNAVIGEYDYQTSPLSSLTLTGSYSLLRFPSSGYINNDDAIFRIGYNHTLTRRDSIALSYQAGIFRFGQRGGDFTNHVLEFTYRRTMTHRLGLQIGAGPQVNLFSTSQNGQDTRVSWEVSSLLNYQFRRFELGLSYRHYTSGGSGVYYGARTDYAQADVSMAITRKWSTDWDFGYAYNENLQSAAVSGTGNSYNAWYGSVNLQRIVNRWMSMFLSYNLRQQIAAVPTCSVGNCGTFTTQQYFSFGFNWHPSRLPDQAYGTGVYGGRY